MLDRGVYLPPSQFEAWFPSLAHTRSHVERTLAAAREAFAEVAVAMSVLGRDRWRAADPALRRARGGRARARPLRAARLDADARRSCSRPSTRATCCTTASRACSTGMDDDLRLLAGDALYALGLARLADGGDLAAVAELADLISLSPGPTPRARGELAEALWEASAARPVRRPEDRRASRSR